ncbi:MAG: RsmB/NOP family class I SAM-dependent RNA methyltransferase [Planctomycetota bacterium]|jgi:16S rRNA (cytosine967-C5)-methyltransferase
MICIKGPRDITRLTGFAEGLFTVQDITASKPVRMLMHCRFPIAECRFSNRKWKIVNRKFLDLCAAPGTKTTQLAEVTCDSARIVATDIDNKRLEMVRENVIRLGMNHIDVVPYEELPGISDFRLPNADFQIANRKSQIANSFDCVLLDVPCSNTGVLAKRVEARYRISPQAIKKLLRIQAGLLETAAGLVKPAGLICYSTCSIQKKENSNIIENFLEKNKNFTLEKEQLTLPSAENFDHDGGYCAVLKHT